MCKQFTETTAGREPRFSSETNYRQLCKFKCCTSCSYCTRAFAKERSKSRVSSLFFSSEKLQIKICERCFLCHSVVLCQNCNKCQKCCLKSTCRGQTSELLANLGTGPKIVQILKEGYTFPFRTRPNLTRSPTVISQLCDLLTLPAYPVRQFSHRKASSSRSTTYETHTMASQKQLVSTRITRKGHSNTQISAPSPTMVVGGEQCAPRSTITPNKTCSADLYRRLKMSTLPEAPGHYQKASCT